MEYYKALRLSREHAGRPRLVPVVMADQAPGLPFFSQLHQIYASNPTATEVLTAIGHALDNSLTADATPAWARFQPYKGLPALEEATRLRFRHDKRARHAEVCRRALEKLDEYRSVYA